MPLPEVPLPLRHGEAVAVAHGCALSGLAHISGVVAISGAMALPGTKGSKLDGSVFNTTLLVIGGA